MTRHNSLISVSRSGDKGCAVEKKKMKKQRGEKISAINKAKTVKDLLAGSPDASPPAALAKKAVAVAAPPVVANVAKRKEPKKEETSTSLRYDN